MFIKGIAKKREKKNQPICILNLVIIFGKSHFKDVTCDMDNTARAFVIHFKNIYSYLQKKTMQDILTNKTV